MEPKLIKYSIKEPIELNLSYMPFIKDGGLFIPSFELFALGDLVNVELMLPLKKDPILIEGKVTWITPNNALHHVVPGIGIQFIGNNVPTVRVLIEDNLDKSMDIGGYTYGTTDDLKK